MCTVGTLAMRQPTAKIKKVRQLPPHDSVPNGIWKKGYNKWKRSVVFRSPMPERLSFLSSRRIPPPKEQQLLSFSGSTTSTQCSQKSLISIAIQTELTWRQGADTSVPVKTNSQTTQTHSNQDSAKNTGIPSLLLLHQEVTEVQMLQYPLPAKAVKGTLNPHRPLHLQKRTANRK